MRQWRTLRRLQSWKQSAFLRRKRRGERHFAIGWQVFCHFWLLYEDEKLVSMINGMATDEEHLTDAMYEHADMHSKDGAWQMIFGVATDPAEQGKGYAAALMRRVIADTKSQGKKGLVLTCKERLLSFYRQFGYRNEGVSGSEHGGAVWYEMRLTF